MTICVTRVLVAVFSIWVFLPSYAMTQEPILESSVELSAAELRLSLFEMGYISVEISGSKVNLNVF